MGKGRRPCCDKAGVKKGPWSQAEDLKLVSFVRQHGHSNWRALPKLAGLARCGKSCRLRWVNYLRPDLKRGNFTPHEEETIIKLHQELGNKWSTIASKFPGRTDNEIKNVWNTHLKKRLKKDKQCNKKSSSDSCNSLPITMDDTTEEHSSSSSTSSTTTTSQPPSLLLDDLPPLFNDNLGPQTPNIDELLEIPFDPDLDIWELLDGDSQSNSTTTNNLIDVNPITEIDNVSSNNVKNDQDNGSWWWLVYLENELGLDHNHSNLTGSNLGSGQFSKGIET